MVQVLKIYKNKNYLNFLEVGIGSGCIALSILKEKKTFLGTGIDLSQDCIEICRYNAKKLGVNNRIKLFKSDVDNLIFRKYDLIVSNPPYIKKFDLNKLSREVIDYEPKMALDGGLEGLSVIRKVIKKSSVRLNLLQEVSRNNEILVTAQVELAVIDSNGSVSKLPKDLLEKI